MKQEEALKMIVNSVGDGQLGKSSAHRKHFVFRASNYFNVDYSHWSYLQRTKPDGFGVLIYPRPPKVNQVDHFVVLPSSEFGKLLSAHPIGKIRRKGEPTVAGACWNVRCHSGDASKAFLGHNGKQMGIAEFLNRADLFEELILPHWATLQQNLGRGVFEPHEATCPRCGKSTLPDYGRAKVDVQCNNKNCQLWFRGDGHPESERGFFEFNNAKRGWQPFVAVG